MLIRLLARLGQVAAHLQDDRSRRLIEALRAEQDRPVKPALELRRW